MRTYFYFFICMFCGITFASAIADDEINAKEYLVKAAFLYNFIKFVEWPSEQTIAQSHTANICIMGNDPFGGALETIAQKAAAVQPPLILNIKRHISETEIIKCHVLFISQSEQGRISSIMAYARHKPVLTVSELKGFADSGGIIEMVKVEKSIGLFSKDKINLRINTAEAEDSHLHIDAQLLEIAAEIIK